ncbi:MAG: hypothetical protein Q8M07_26365, partial [Prosthecobacter sp.]|nr:hypothetical protein [Prosthecobacter sp.]
DAVMLPSDFFENATRINIFEGSYNVYDCEDDKLAQREKELYRLFDKKGWACFFIGALKNGNSGERRFADLARKMANRTFQRTQSCKPFPHLKSKTDEFGNFFTRHGIAQTELTPPYQNGLFRTLATDPRGDKTYAAELAATRFFLPLKPLSRKGELAEILQTAAAAIILYKKRNDLYLPKWVEDIQFKTEIRLLAEQESLQRRLQETTNDLARWERHKAVLAASGRSLSEVVVDVLRNFFGLNLKSEEAYIEDAMIYSNDGSSHLYVVEIKGVAAGIKREQINQLDSHRERLGLDHSLPGLLIINDFCDTPGMEARKKKPVDEQHLAHATRLNVRILRTTSLIDLMLASEELRDRTSFFLKACEQASPLVLAPLGSEEANNNENS